jgi:hypothetical protein
MRKTFFPGRQDTREREPTAGSVERTLLAAPRSFINQILLWLGSAVAGARTAEASLGLAAEIFRFLAGVGVLFFVGRMYAFVRGHLTEVRRVWARWLEEIDIYEEPQKFWFVHRDVFTPALK